MIRTGIGYDVHQLVKGEKLVVGSVEIVSSIGSLGHSDGDALIHSICDALLGAANLGDLGHFFPSEDVKWKDSESVYFLKDVISKIENKVAFCLTSTNISKSSSPDNASSMKVLFFQSSVLG